MNRRTSGTTPIVVGVDGSEPALQAVRWAARDAAYRHAPLHLVYALGVVELLTGAPVVPHGIGPDERLRANAWRHLNAAEEVAHEAAKVAVECELEPGAARWVLLDAARRARMLVLGFAGYGSFFGEHRLGSTAAHLAAQSGCPVAVVRGGPRPDEAPVVVGLDGSPQSDAALAYAFEEADYRGAPLVAMRAWADTDARAVLTEPRFLFDTAPYVQTEQRLLAEQLAGWGAKYPDVRAKRVVATGRPGRKLLELSRDAQLLVVGSRGRGAVRGALLGSVSQTLVHHADCPVLAIHTKPMST